MPDGSFIARNSLVGKPIHRADVRLLKSFPLGARRRVEGMLDLFNAFNHANYGSYLGEEQRQFRNADAERRPELSTADDAARVPDHILGTAGDTICPTLD